MQQHPQRVWRYAKDDRNTREHRRQSDTLHFKGYHSVFGKGA
jgi:hypothetical protein